MESACGGGRDRGDGVQLAAVDVETACASNSLSAVGRTPSHSSTDSVHVAFDSNEHVIIPQHGSESFSGSDQELCAQEPQQPEEVSKARPRRWSILPGCMSDDELTGQDMELKRLLSKRRVHKGVCWKLVAAHTEAPNVESMATVMNWRRREFVVKKDENHVGIVYTSEKNNGEAGYACTLRSGTEMTTTFEELPAVVMEAPDAATKMEICRSLHSYDLCICQMKAYKNASLYESSIPEMLFPLDITWLDVDTRRIRHTVLGMTKEETRALWLKKLQGFTRDRPGVEAG